MSPSGVLFGDCEGGGQVSSLGLDSSLVFRGGDGETFELLFACFSVLTLGPAFKPGSAFIFGSGFAFGNDFDCVLGVLCVRACPSPPGFPGLEHLAVCLTLTEGSGLSVWLAFFTSFILGVLVPAILKVTSMFMPFAVAWVLPSISSALRLEPGPRAPLVVELVVAPLTSFLAFLSFVSHCFLRLFSIVEIWPGTARLLELKASSNHLKAVPLVLDGGRP